jgi:hypothetical protein
MLSAGSVGRMVDPAVPAAAQPVNRPLPGESSMGAVPLYAAKWSRFLKRDMSRTSPMMVAVYDRADAEQAGQAGLNRRFFAQPISRRNNQSGLFLEPFQAKHHS